MEIRQATTGDLSALAELEKRCFPHDPWSEQMLTGCCAADCPTVVLTDGDRLLGYVTGRMMPPEAELYRICVLPELRGTGCGRRLADAFHTLLREGGCTDCYLEVRASNAAARALYKALGYHEIAMRKNYYHAPVEDAVIETVKLGVSPCFF